MAQEPQRLLAIDIPRPCEALTPVRVDMDQVGAGDGCPSGWICARGDIPVPSGEDIIEVRAYVYHENPIELPAEPPADSRLYEPPQAQTEFFFDENHGNLIPDVRCEKDAPRDDNWLVIWAKWLAEEDAATIADEWQYKAVTRVCGIAATKTECET